MTRTNSESRQVFVYHFSGIHHHLQMQGVGIFGCGKDFINVYSGGECSENARRILDVANAGGDEMLYIKRDGSLSEGMELVSHPATIDWHLNHFPWERG